jgi:dsRNA-specific ribonuclease
MMVKKGDKTATKIYSTAIAAEELSKRLVNEMTTQKQMIEIKRDFDSKLAEENWNEMLQGLHDAPLDTSTGALLYPSGSIPVLMRYNVSVELSSKIEYVQVWPSDHTEWETIRSLLLSSLPRDMKDFRFIQENTVAPPYGYVFAIDLLILGQTNRIYGGLRMTKKLAQKHACFVACLELHSKGLLNDHIFPAQQPTNKPQVQVDETHLIPRRVPTTFRKDDSRSTSLYVTTLLFHFPNLQSDLRFSKEDSVAILTYQPFQIAQLNPWYVRIWLDKEIIHGSFSYVDGGCVTLDPSDEQLLKQYQNEVWNVILSVRQGNEKDKVELPPHLRPGNVKNELSYMIAPVSWNSKWTIDWPLVRLFLEQTLPLSDGWHRWESKLHDLLIKTPHNNQLYCRGIKSSKLPSETFLKRRGGVETETTFVNYFNGLGYQISSEQPMLQMRRCGSILSFHYRDLATAEKESEHTSEDDVQSPLIFLPREACQVVPISNDFLFKLKLVPNILYLMETEALMNDFLVQFEPMDRDCLRQCFYATSAEMHFNYERLETLGDSFLKFAVGLDLFTRPGSKNGKSLSILRSETVSNKNLQHIAEKLGLHTWMQTNPFLPQYFNPPEEVEISKVQVLQREVNPKRRADFVEALCGGYCVSGGFQCAWNFLQQCEIVIGYMKPYCFEKVSDLQIQRVKSVSTILGHSFDSLSILSQILTHPSMSDQNYEKYEFLGDAILDLLVMKYFFEKYRDANPGKLSMMKSSVVNNDILAYLCYEVGIYHYIVADAVQISEIEKYAAYAKDLSSPLDDKEYEPPKVLADIMEAVIAGIYVDMKGDLDYTWKALFPVFESILDRITPDQQLTNPTRLFREKIHQMGLSFDQIKYRFWDGELIHCEIIIKGHRIAAGTANTRKYAKRRASQKGLEWIEQIGQILLDSYIL